MSAANEAQIQYWNGRAGEKWAALQVSLDAMLAPVTAELQARVGAIRGLRVLDVGCGTGETCAIWLDTGAEVTGVDVSAPMLALAARRTDGKARLIEADAAAFRADIPYDLAVSRFGVMFFDAPDAAFANIGANLRPGGRLLFACWRSLSENPWAAMPMELIRDLLPEAPPAVPHAPGPFALADSERLRRILEGAGFTDVVIEPVDLELCLAREGGVEAALSFIMESGPAARALAEVSDEVRSVAAGRLKSALLPHESQGSVTLGGAVWMVHALCAG